jgi:hypothetical protein
MSFETVKQSGAVDYLLRTTQQHHVRLSVMADQKANIMIAATSILLTFAFANFKQQNLFWGFLALFVSAFVSLILAIRAVSPRFWREDEQAQLNSLFFGHFVHLPLEDYYEEMELIMSSDKETYEAIVKDIYYIGQNLQHHKYKHLHASYRVFLLGIVIAGALFVLQTALFYLT